MPLRRTFSRFAHRQLSSCCCCSSNEACTSGAIPLKPYPDASLFGICVAMRRVVGSPLPTTVTASSGQRSLQSVASSSQSRAATTVAPPSAAMPSASLLHIPTVTLSPPATLSHEHLAYAHCPICRQLIHMCDMYLHLTSKHKELHPKHCHKTCHERLALYESIMGEPLRKATTSPTPSCPSSVAEKAVPTSTNPNNAASAVATPSGRQASSHRGFQPPGGISMDKWMTDFLPTVVSTGNSTAGYVCNWCERRDVGTFVTRDQFLKHVAMMHPEFDLDRVDALIPVPQTSSSAGSPSVAGRSGSGPRRRLLHVVQGVAEEDIVLPPPPVMPARSARSPMTTNTQRDFDAMINCELCRRSFANEQMLLNHMFGSHPYGDLTPGPYTPDAHYAQHSHASSNQANDLEAAALDTVRRFQQLELTRSDLSQSYSVRCPKCAADSRFYARPSALYSHLHMKHPEYSEAEDFVMNTIGDRASATNTPASSTAASDGVKCSACSRVFGTRGAMEAHFREKHAASSAFRLSSTGLRLGDLHGNVWWCNECERGFASARALHGHLQTVHSQPTEAVPCPACRRVFPDVFSLRDHCELSHKLDATTVGTTTHASCEHCERQFLTPAEASKHEKKHHRVAPSKPLALSIQVIDDDSANGSNVVAKASDAPVVPVRATPRKLARRIASPSPAADESRILPEDVSVV